MFFTTKTGIATGGITEPTQTVIDTMMQAQIGSYPSDRIAGKKIGVARIIKARSSITDPPKR
jgi:hypothetical protein